MLTPATERCARNVTVWTEKPEISGYSALSHTAWMAQAGLVIHGDADRLTAVVGSRRLAATLGSDDVTLREWPGAYHELHHEPERDEVLDTIVSWIGERVGRAD